MEAALALARRGLGRVAPNPAVGCILVRDGTVVGRGWTQPGGRPHAETEALVRAAGAAHGATAYVTLEPCAHHGRTPPCADALVESGIARAVVALDDPDPRVAGRGLARLRGAGIATDVGLMAREAERVNAGFLMRIRAGRPLVTLKLATSLDGRIATSGGESRWITGAAARRAAHLLRASHDAVMVGSGTALADDPALTCRLPGLEDRAPLRIVVDGRLRLPETATLVRTAAERPTLVLTGPAPDAARRAALERLGVTVEPVPDGPDGHLDLVLAMQRLGARGLTRVLVEGGGTLAAALLAADLADRLVWHRAPLMLGGDGVAAVGPLALGRLAEAHRFARVDLAEAGGDLLEAYERAP